MPIVVVKHIVNNLSHAVLTALPFSIFLTILVPLQFYLASPEQYFFTVNALFYFLISLIILTLIQITIFLIFLTLNLKIFYKYLKEFFILYLISSLLFIENPVLISGIFFRDDYLIKNYNIFHDIFLIMITIMILFFKRKLDIYISFPTLSYFILFGYFLICVADTFVNQRGIFNHERSYSSSEGFNLQEKDNLYNENIIPLSSTEKNIVIFMLDTFSGNAVKDIFEKDKNLQKSFSDYTWYPDTLSVGRATVSGELAILSGSKNSPHILNERVQTNNSGEPLSTVWEKSFNSLSEIVHKKAGTLNIWSPISPYTKDCDNILDTIKVAIIDSNVNCVDEFAILEEYFYKKNYSANPAEQTYIFGIFYLLPPFLKKYVYKSNIWIALHNRHQFERIVSDIEVNNREKFKLSSAIKNISFKNINAPTVTYIRSNYSHYPFATRRDCKPIHDLSEIIGQDLLSYEFSYYQNMKCTLEEVAKLNKKLSELKQKDNTVVILVSDHDAENGFFYHPQALLFVKHLPNESSLNVNNSLMSNEDILGLVECYLIMNKNCVPDIKERIRFTSVTPSHIDNQYKNMFKIDKMFKVNGTIFNKENWQQIR